jgi:redox-sensitive bicupin YhaK (pirin superfamily)
VPLASGLPGDDEALPIRTPGRVLGATVRSGETLDYDLAPGRRAYLVPARGAVEVNGVRVGTRDGAAINDEPRLRITALDDAELVMVDTV